ncbi:MAG: alpha/beta hydrolase [Deltaproteobacteria bacterium]|nr:alpha/beta hydrolase [Deltaproteobacteria bacterium]
MTIITITILCLLLLVIGIYCFPVRRASFDSLYADVPEKERDGLRAFRSDCQPRLVRIEGDEWRYLITGEGNRSIVFLHGMGGGYDIWWQQVRHFGKNYRVLAMTYPPIHNLADLSKGVIAIMDKEGLESVRLVGSSLGGYLAQYIVRHYPARIEKAVFGNTFPPNDILVKQAGRMRWLLPMLPEWMIMANLRKTTDASIVPASGNSELVGAYMREQSRGMMHKAQFVSRFQCVLDHFDPPDVEGLGVPVHIIEADNDPLVNEALRELLKATYPTAAVKTFHRKGHFPYLNAAEAYNLTLEEFFNGKQ